MATPQLTILIVEDNAEDRSVVRRYLERDRTAIYLCHEASTIAEGLAQCRSLRPDAVLVDYSLPDDTGLEFLEAAFAEHGPLAFATIMLTGSGNEAVAVQALKIGAQDYLVKEGALEHRLSLTVAGAIDKVRLQRQVEQQRRDLEASNAQLQQALDSRMASEAQLRMALQSAQMSTWEWDLSTNKIVWGPGLREMLGIPSGGFGGDFEAFHRLVHPDDFALVRRRLDIALRGDTPYELEFRMLRRDGSVRWTATRGSVVRDRQGQPVRMIGVDMDISDRKLAESELRASEERYRALVTATADLVWRTNGNGEMLSISSLWSDLTGQSESELRGWGWVEVVHPDDIAPALERWREALASHSTYENEFRVRARDGSYRRFYGRGVPLIEADGSVREWIGYSSDITERRKIEEQLERSEMQFRAMVENLPDVISRFDRELRHLYVSPEIERATGMAPESFVGKTHAELDIAPDPPDIWVRHLKSVFETGDAASFEFMFVSPVGPRYYQSTIIPERANNGSFETVLSIVRDVTDYKQAEQRLRFLSDASKALTVSLDYQTTLQHLARLAIPYFGDACIIDLAGEYQDARASLVAHVDPVQEELLSEMRRQYAPEWNSAHPVARVLRSGQPLIVDQISHSLIDAHLYDDGHRMLVQQLAPRSCMMVPFVVRGQKAGVISLYATQAQRRYTPDDLEVLEELARRAAIALDNAALYQEAQEAIREREAFLSITSHEVKNPLTTLLGRSQMLRRRLERMGENARALDDIDMVIEQSKRINRLLTDLLDASRLETGQFMLAPTPLDLCELVQRVVAELQPSAPKHSITCTEPATRMTIAGDASRLEQVFYNLISNAVKYSPAGGTIAVRVYVEGSNACVSVSDEGLGMPADALPHLFKRFYRVSNPSAPHITGSGIGLYVVKEIVSGHRGTVDVRSVEGRGSTFTIRLPLSNYLERGQPAG